MTLIGLLIVAADASTPPPRPLGLLGVAAVLASLHTVVSKEFAAFLGMDEGPTWGDSTGWQYRLGPDAAQDVVAETFLAAFRRRGQLRQRLAGGSAVALRYSGQGDRPTPSGGARLSQGP